MDNEVAICYRCDTQILSQNSSYEHIILNACGGKLKSKTLLCKKCNSDFGNSFDNILAVQVNELANMLMIKRERGEPQPIEGKTANGTAYKIFANGDLMKADPTVQVQREGNQVRLSINAANDEQYRQILKGIKRKNPGFDADEAFKVAERSNYYLNEPINIQMNMGGPDVFRSIIKTAINYFIHLGGKSADIKHLLPFLEKKVDLENVWYHYPDQYIYHPKIDEVSHILKIVGDPEQKLLFAYVELFNAHNYIVLLNQKYTGKAINSLYAYDLINNQEFQPVVQLDYSRNYVLDLFLNKDAHPHLKITERLNRTFKIANERQVKFHLNKLISSAVHDVLGAYPKGTVFTNELITKMQQEVRLRVMPFIEHQRYKKKINR